MITGKKLVEEYKKTIGMYTYEQRDCIGSIWKILEQYGAKADTIGSNWFARHELRNMRPLTSRSQLYDGCAVLKSKLPGESGYALPDRYLSDDDLIDYNHIGIGTNDGQILDSTRYKDSSGGYVRNGPGISTADIGPYSWDIIGDFEDVASTPGEGKPMGKIGYINLPAGKTVKHRIKPNDQSPWYGYIKGGEAIEIVSESNGWTRAKHGGNDGYIMSSFITATTPAPADPVAVDTVALLSELSGLLERAQSIIKLL